MDGDGIRSGFPAPDLATTTAALNDILETEEARVLAANLKRKMEALSERYKEMNVEDREHFEKEFASRFQDSMEKLKRTIQEKVSTSTTQKIPQGESSSSETETGTGLQIIGFLIVAFLIG